MFSQMNVNGLMFVLAIPTVSIPMVASTVTVLNDGQSCVDLDECIHQSEPCGPIVNSTCENTFGSYSCVCDQGLAPTYGPSEHSIKNRSF